MNASERAIVMAEALGKRAFGSLARLRRITAHTADEIFGLMEAGGGGGAL